MRTTLLSVAALATSALAHGDHEHQVPIAGPHKVCPDILKSFLPMKAQAEQMQRRRGRDRKAKQCRTRQAIEYKSSN